MEAAAIPGIAVPLLQDDCIDTTVDLDWVWDYIHLTAEDKTTRMDLGQLREDVASWFESESLTAIMGDVDGETEAIGRQWLARAGKRWRPFLSVAAYQALRDEPGSTMPEDLKKVAVAVACFHKASLIHDDIEDQDTLRYGEKTLHEEYGMPVALNVGDLLIGEGYRLLGECDIAAENRVRMLTIASEGQRQLCRGQGAELCWTQSPKPLASREVLDIFRRKTAPAFDVALQLGAAYAGADDGLQKAMAEYSKALGIAYQIRDDLDDMGSHSESNDLASMRPSLPLAVAYEKAKDEQKAMIDSIWRRQPQSGLNFVQVEALYKELGADTRSKTLLEAYKEQAIRSLRDVENLNLKGLLRRVLGKIFNDTEIKGWCKEFEQKNGVARTENETKAVAVPVS